MKGLFAITLLCACGGVGSATGSHSIQEGQTRPLLPSPEVVTAENAEQQSNYGRLDLLLRARVLSLYCEYVEASQQTAGWGTAFAPSDGDILQARSALGLKDSQSLVEADLRAEYGGFLLPVLVSAQSIRLCKLTNRMTDIQRVRSVRFVGEELTEYLESNSASWLASISDDGPHKVDSNNGGLAQLQRAIDVAGRIIERIRCRTARSGLPRGILYVISTPAGESRLELRGIPIIYAGEMSYVRAEDSYLRWLMRRLDKWCAEHKATDDLKMMKNSMLFRHAKRAAELLCQSSTIDDTETLRDLIERYVVIARPALEETPSGWQISYPAIEREREAVELISGARYVAARIWCRQCNCDLGDRVEVVQNSKVGDWKPRFNCGWRVVSNEFGVDLESFKSLRSQENDSIQLSASDKNLWSVLSVSTSIEGYVPLSHLSNSIAIRSALLGGGGGDVVLAHIGPGRELLIHKLAVFSDPSRVLNELDWIAYIVLDVQARVR